MKTGDKKQFEMYIEYDKISIDLIYVDGIGYVADRNVCLNKSYNWLEQQGLVEGRKVTFDGVDYICRILTSFEWDDIMDWDDSNDTWHWCDVYSWVRSLELERAKSSYRVFRGSSSAVIWGGTTTGGSGSNIGFRPVLVPLISNTLNSDETPQQSANALTLNELVNGIVEHKDELATLIRLAGALKSVGIEVREVRT